MSLKSASHHGGAGLGLAAVPLSRARRRHAADVSVGGGLRTSFIAARTSTRWRRRSFSDFAVNSARLYFSGKATENIGFMFNTEYNSNDEEIRIIDAVAQFSFAAASTTSGRAASCRRAIAPISTARTTPATGRVYQDGVQDGYPFETEGRDDGIAYWGQFGKVKASFGAVRRQPV